MRKVSIFFSIFFVVCFCVGLVHVPVVEAVSYYNWIFNPSFEYNTNLIEDSGFESGLENQGQYYGNWSLGADASFSLAQHHNGVYSVKSEVVTDGKIWYNFTDEIQGADVEEFSGYVYCAGGGNEYRVRVYYSDDTTDYDDYADAASAWILNDDWVDIIDPMKYVVAFYFDAQTSYDYYFDDISFIVYEASNPESQTSVGYDTEPWYLNIGASWDNPNEISESVSNYGDNSFKWNIEDNGDSTYVLTQIVNWLDSDSVHFLDLYLLMGVGATCELNVMIFYDGGDSSQKTYDYTGTGAFQHINMGNNWVQSGRLVTNLCIWLDEVIGSYAYIDDIGLWCSVPKGQTRFEYAISPYPINGYHAYEVNLYYGVTYSFYGWLNDEDGNRTENGTFSVTHDKGITNGTISLGAFNFVISQRIGSSNKLESFSITMLVEDEVIVVCLNVNWIYAGSPYQQGGGEDEDAGIIGNSDFVLLLIMVFVPMAPALLFAEAAPKDMKTQAFFGGMAIGAGALVVTGIAPFWFVAVDIFAVALFFVTMLRKA